MNRADMKALAASCAERLTPRRMVSVAKGKERGTDREVEVIAFPGVEFRPGPQPLYTRRIDQKPELRPAVKRNRFGQIIARFVLTPTAPLRRVQRDATPRRVR